MNNSNKIILDLCGGTGAWSKPYRDAGYDVRVITLPDYDVTNDIDKMWCINLKPYGILAAPPCTMFSFARTNAKKQRDLKEGMECVRDCLDIIWSVMEVKQDTAKKTINMTPKLWIRISRNVEGSREYLPMLTFGVSTVHFGSECESTESAIWYCEIMKRNLEDAGSSKVLFRKRPHKGINCPIKK